MAIKNKVFVKDIDLLQKMLVEKGWNQAQLHKAAKVSEGTISNILNPKKRTSMFPATAKRIAEALDINIEEEEGSILFYKIFEVVYG